MCGPKPSHLNDHRQKSLCSIVAFFKRSLVDSNHSFMKAALEIIVGVVGLFHHVPVLRHNGCELGGPASQDTTSSPAEAGSAPASG